MEDPSNAGKPTLTSDPKESAESQASNNLEDPRGEDEPAPQDQSNTNSEGHPSDKGEAGSSASDGKRISAKEDFIELNDILHALKTTVDHPSDLAKHSEERTTIKNSNLSKYYTRNPTTRPLFAFAERDYNEWDLEDVIPNSFIKRVPEWLRVTKLPYEQLRSKHLKHHGEDAAYKSFSEVFSRLVGEREIDAIFCQ